MRLISLLTIAAFLSLALHVSTEHTGAEHGDSSVGHHIEGMHACFEHPGTVPLCDHSDTPPHNVNSMRKMSRASERDIPLVLIPFVSSIPNRIRMAVQDTSSSPAPRSDDVALHLSACVFLL